MASNLTREQAIELGKSEFWKGMAPRHIAEFQMSESRLCMPFAVFQEALEKTLGRSVFTHEFGLNYDGLKAELFEGKAPPSFEEIVNLIPEAKRIVFALSDDPKTDADRMLDKLTAPTRKD